MPRPQGPFSPLSWAFQPRSLPEPSCAPNRRWPAILYKCMVFAWTQPARRHGRRRAGMPSCSVLPPPSRAHDPLPDHPAAPGDLPQAGTRRRLGWGAGARSRIRSAGGCRPMGHGNLVYHSPKPRRDGRTTLVLSPLELIDALAGLIPPPRRHRHRYHGVLAPNSPLRAAVTAYGREETPSPQAPAKTVSATEEEPAAASPTRYLWAMLLARLFESLPLVCPCCCANTCLPAGRCASSPSSPRPHPSSRSSWLSVSHPGHLRSRPPADRPPGTGRPSRRRTGTWPLSPSSISVSPGSLLQEAVLSAFVLLPSGMTPNPAPARRF